MSHKVLTTIALIGILIALVGCGTVIKATPALTVVPQTSLTISGSGTVTSILIAVKSAFEANMPGYHLKVMAGTGTGGGVQGIIQGVLDVAAMARPPKDEEAAQGVEYVEFGQSGVAVLAHPAVDVTNLTTAQVAAIFSGEVTDWSEVGGASERIILYVRDEGESSTQALRSGLFGDMPFPETAQVLTSQADMQAAVSGTPGGVGFGSWPSALAGGADMRAIALDGVAPDDPAYPISTPIGIGYLADRQADVQPLIDWLLSEQGQAVLGEFGVITTR
jgi:phosphate transport system substrate-binding protein